MTQNNGYNGYNDYNRNYSGQNQQQGYRQNNPGYDNGNYYQNPMFPPYQEYTQNNPFNCGPTGKSRGIFCILAFFFGTIGLQYFYAGKTLGGVLSIIISIVTCGAWAIIPMLQGIILLWNYPNEEFYNKFIASNSGFPLF